ncbi:MAG: phosphoribosylformylglycinamidine synthase subunit PurS [Geovibrio sp.]|jgi:phosphoribosylformylglycinamidine synthase|uniref:phosphoribosylformylglycinamidine synthase subunit PurS n=1 Tax=Geovibrio ferrireducens TaxID=46201 RepID=UPI0022463272|nr:phosphoribosylformylglycinamidine synthase subunit PurS [Geovibrio ferrireducens]MCD8492829.1 phosphoribosylformylglycinamidine synthase subunit PurS [Geovibrio sp.]
MKAQVFVKFKNGVLDPQGQTILGAVNRMGHGFVKDVKVGKFFEIEIEKCENPEEKLKEIADKVLANPIIEEFRIEIPGEK